MRPLLPAAWALARVRRGRSLGAHLEVGELADLARQVGHANEVEVELAQHRHLEDHVRQHPASSTVK